ncbi:hypothetical protein M758_3G034500 [Ceratodon purpureus]|nr:hypothetical protein M758_3G034500 [Ceratodon purpureus]KAG0621610.1 hypothetical protein M758_3G034500 [Ceratodon purpureus]KAG0621611.1 hypothetical protein M758_3G034500 [Ceratodon purpureus]
MEESILGDILEESIGGPALEEPLADAAMEAPSMDTVTEEPVVGIATEEEFSASAFSEEASAEDDTEVSSAKKLLVLDVNGLLVATYHKAQKMPGDLHPFKLGNFYVYERPGCSEFLDFCFKNFVVGVWSSAREHNVTNLVNHIFKDLKQELSFSWHQRHCTTTAVKHPDNEKKPIFLKELSKLWAEVNPGRFDQSNTLLIDDSPYKALKNPPHTAIFPQTYNGDEVDDNFLTELRSYLEGLRDAPDVQEYVRNNPIGEPGISSESPLWGYFAPILNEGAQELNLAAVAAVGNGATPAVVITQQVQEFASQLNPEEIELEDMEQPAKRRDLSPVAVAGHSSRREPRDETAEEIHWRRNAGNELENDRAHSRRNFERERERSPRMRTNHLDRRRFATSRERDTNEFVHHPRSNHIGDYNTRRDDRSRGSWHDRSGVRDTSLSRESFGRRSSEHDIGRALPSPGGRQFMTSGINIRDLPPPPVFSAQDSGRGLLPPPMLPPRTWENAERPALHYDSYGGRRHVLNLPMNAPIELPRNWEKPVIPARGREYDRRWEDSLSTSVERGYDRGWVRPISSGRGSEFDRRWEEPVSSGRGHEYDRRWEEPVSSARGSEYDRRWKEPVGSARVSEYDRRWKEPVSAGRERGYNSGWDTHASSSHGKEYDSRWGEPAPATNIGRGREYGTRWDEPVHSDYRKSDYERRWEPPLSSGNTRDYDSKWSKAPVSQYAPPPPRVEYSSQGYRNPSVDYKGRYPHADRNMAVAPRDDTRHYHWNAPNNYRR